MMKNEASTVSTAASEVAKPRKAYHTPRLENYGAVNELTRSGANPSLTDGGASYSYSS